MRKGPSSRLPGGTGRGEPLGGAGEDFIETKDGEQDELECDSGNNIARVDFGDRIARGYAGSWVWTSENSPSTRLGE